MLELMSYGLTGLVSILLIAFCFACKDECASSNDKPSSSPMYDAELGHPKPVERCACAANGDTGPQCQQHEGSLHG
jgi:hypothetical protein